MKDKKPITFGILLLLLLGGVLYGLYHVKQQSSVPVVRSVIQRPEEGLLSGTNSAAESVVEPGSDAGVMTSKVAVAQTAEVLKPVEREVMSEEVLKTLRRSFIPPRFQGDPNVPRERQTLLSNRILIAGQERRIALQPSGRQSPTLRDTTPFIVQFNQPVSAEMRTLVEEHGGFVHGFLPNNAVLAELTPQTLQAMQALSPVHAVDEFLPTDKIQPFLQWLTQSHTEDVLISVTVQTLSPEYAAPVAEKVVDLEGRVLDIQNQHGRGLLSVVVPLKAIDALAGIGEVHWVEETPVPRILNDLAAFPGHLNVTNLWHTYGLSGRGQVIGHADTGIDSGVIETLHVDFTDRVRAIIARGRPGNGSDTHGHGTHTAGSIVGSGAASNGQFRGIAWEAELVHQSVMNSAGKLTGIGSLYGLFLESYNLGARIHSDSWGDTESVGIYDTLCSVTDQFAWDYPDHLAVFAAGNSGKDGNSDGVIDAASVLSPASAKNVVAVGATESDRPSGSGGFSYFFWWNKWGSLFPVNPIKNDLISFSATTNPYQQGMAAFSSRGPVEDGRIKPDVVAPGTDIISTRTYYGNNTLWGLYSPNTAYRFNGGTSMAAPLVAGTAALLRQYAVEYAGITNPSAALVKAMLVGGARSLAPGQYGRGQYQEIPDVSPNNVEGWGQPDLGATLFPDGAGPILLDHVAPIAGSTNVIKITVVESGKPLDIALVWIDYPATMGAAPALVNNFDLAVKLPDNTVVYPNGGLAPDTVNTVETICLNSASAGEYEVWIAGTTLPYAGSVAALYLCGAVAPLLTHNPASDFVAEAPPRMEFTVQPPAGAAGYSDITVEWASGNESMPTQAWSSATATLLTNAQFMAEIPIQPPGTYLYYYFQVDSLGVTPVRLPVLAPAEYFAVQINSTSPWWELTVVSPYSTTSPQLGSWWLAENTRVNAVVISPVGESSGTRLQVSGWTLSDHEPAVGTTTSLSFAITNHTVLTWQWETAHYLQVESGTNGSLVPTSQWLAADTLIHITAYPDNYYYLGSWHGDTHGATLTESSLELTMDQPRTVGAVFVPKLTALRGVPEYWLASYGWSNDFEVVAETDQDGDGMPTWQEWLADTDPTDPLSKLAVIGLTLSNQWASFTWQGGVLRTQQVEYAAALQGPWQVVATNLPPTVITNHLWLPYQGGAGFYRINLP